MPASPDQTEYISDLFEQCCCDGTEVESMLEEVTGIVSGQWPGDAEKISVGNASDLIEALKDLERDQDRPVGRREYGR